ncbi:hypothetical protein BD309DRAFT_143562 [Dichomitus squalens]|nr:hypothetical protein BD309DRAFT_143562 [Dichomitus squalens]
MWHFWTKVIEKRRAIAFCFPIPSTFLQSKTSDSLPCREVHARTIPGSGRPAQKRHPRPPAVGIRLREKELSWAPFGAIIPVHHNRVPVAHTRHPAPSGPVWRADPAQGEYGA